MPTQWYQPKLSPPPHVTVQGDDESGAGDACVSGEVPAHLPDNFLGYSKTEQERISSDIAKDDPKYEEFYCRECWNFYYYRKPINVVLS